VRRWFYWSGVVLGVLLLVGGGAVAVLGYAETSGPGGAVRGYFAALTRGDAADALAFGDVPAGPHTLLTGDVLRAQQRIAPLRKFSIVATHRSGDKARVSVRYTLAYATGAQTINAGVGLHRSGGDWRLDRVAIPTTLELDRALHRATIVGAGIPEGDTLIFPGAVPITFDTPYLQLNAAEDSIGFGTQPDTEVFVEVSRAGRTAAVGAVGDALRSCLTGGADVRCPQPSERYVPGTLRGTLTEPLAGNLTVTLTDSPDGVLDVVGSQPVRASSFRRLTFTNQPVAGRGRVVLPVHARAFAVRPLTVAWVTQ
jgi:hypothetical protein